VHDWSEDHIVELLRTGVSARGAVMGPMSEVVGGSTQYLSEPDLHAMAGYLKALPQPASERAAPLATEDATTGPGAKLYEHNCSGCHGDHGEGVPGIYPALAGSRAVTLSTPANLVHIVLEGGFPPATSGNPRPFGMPPFATVLSNDEIAQLLTHVRGSWGNRASAVSALDVTKFRTLSAR
jgi:mono/diheme cytochrome c family protein